MITLTNAPFLLVIITYAISLLNTADSLKWPTAEQEALDERNDYEMLKAVQQSMLEWRTKSHHKHNRRKRDDSAALGKVCYGNLGCFEDSGPFGYLDMLPASPEDMATKFVFYSTKNRGDRAVAEFSYFNISAAVGVEEEIERPTEYSTTEDLTFFETTTGTATNPTTTTSSYPTTTNVPLPLSKLRKRSSSDPQFYKTQLDRVEGLKDLPIRVIVHGFGSSCPHVWIYELRTALMSVDDCVVICVDWERGAVLPNYVKAAANTRLVGKQVARLLMALEKHKDVDMERVHIIGFSLGAHVAGFAGAELTGLNRITGLDPAGPLFEAQHPKARLDSTDAKFVDVIHSNGENLILGGLGSWQPMGTVDFYPNGGRVQHGCSNLFVGAVTDFIWAPSSTVVEGRSLCNHRRAYKFFINSISQRCVFPAFPCSSYDDFLHGNCFDCDKRNDTSECGNMGYYADRSTGKGQLYLVTREEEPFCASQFNVEVFSAVSELPLRTMGKFEAVLIGESGLNETFTVTDKDDTELFAGEKIGKVMVPHPALGFPTSISLTYKSYNGWLSRGLQLWNIYKVVVTDSYGQSYSICKRFFALESGVPVRFDLLPGNCHIPEEVYELDELSPPVTLDRVDGDRTEYNKYEAIKVIGNYGLTEEGENHNANLPWQNLIEGNGLERESTESSRGFDATDNGSAVTEVFDPALRNDASKLNRGRNLEGFQGEIVEPVLKSTTQRTRDQLRAATQQRTPTTTSNRQSREEQGFLSVQLFPFRLGELLERAERYARQTLLPLISETAPKFFGFGTVVNEESSGSVNSESERKGKELVLTHDEIEEDSRPKNIYESLREKPTTSESKETNATTKVVQSRSIKEIKFYVNDNEVNSNSHSPVTAQELEIERSDPDVSAFGSERRGHQITLDDIRLDLPTYRPPGRMVKDFPYEFVSPAGDERLESTTLGATENESTTSTTTQSSPTKRSRMEKVDRSWLSFDIPVFRALSRSFQDWTMSSASPPIVGKNRRASNLKMEGTDDQEEVVSQRQVPARRFIPLFGGIR